VLREPCSPLRVQNVELDAPHAGGAQPVSPVSP
jgi:hypothetical protein